MYRSLIKPLLFRFEPETAHHMIFRLLGIMGWIPGWLPLLRWMSRNKAEEAVTIAGLRFPNRVGLAAGFDKDAKRFRELGALGFGFIEVGTVTPLPQAGNPQPRLFRLPTDEALINRMGFNNEGVSHATARLRKSHHGLVIGGNIGKNKMTPNERALADYEACFRSLFSVVDYFVVNVSSPNTPGLRELQEKEPLKALLESLQHLNLELAKTEAQRPRPIFLKIAPDLTTAQLDDVVDVILSTHCAGIIATNTTIDRSGLATDAAQIESIGAGGLSGKPVSQKSTEVIRYISGKAAGKFSVIGVGGIHSAADALEKLDAGADLVQLYTGFVYEGPGLIKKIRQAVMSHKASSGLT